MSIEVHVRIRPGVEHCVWSSAETVLYSTVNPNTRYIYNKVHPSNSSNRTIFQGIEAIVHAAYDGKNTTIMAYGQTGSGKTHSMIGIADDAGIVPRAARLLLELKKHQPGTTVQAYYTEIYNESVRDLLEPQRGELQLHDAPDGGVMFEKKTVNVESFEDFLKLQGTAERNRKYGVTNLNDHSSRSHIILTFEITRPNRNGSSVLNLVDLAGSESAARANTEGQALREGGFINRSLLTLGNVVDAIVEKRSHVPYRSAKLTRILRTCLGGSGITLILCCVNPSRENFEQTVSALRFTQRAMKIRNDPVVVLSLPPLFTHQYSDGAKQLIDGMQECSAAEYQRGLRDSYMYCNSTCHSIVGDYRTNVADSLHSLANAQRLLIAHDHAAAIDCIGRLYVQVNEEERQKTQNEAIAEDERRRQHEAAEQIDERKAKLARLEVEVKETTCSADTDLAGWEYKLRTAQKRQVSAMALLISQEQTRRARIFYEWAVCMERIAARCGPQCEDLLFSTLEMQQKRTEADSRKRKRSETPTPPSSLTTTSSQPPHAGSHSADTHTAMLGEAEAQAEPVGAVLSVAAVRNPPSKTTALKEMRVKLAQAREEVAQLELAHEMVLEDVKEAKMAQQQKKKSKSASETAAAAVGADTGTGGGVVGDLDSDEEELLLSTYEGVPDNEIERQLRQLQDDEKHLLAKARRDVRKESLRRVRESLRLDRAVRTDGRRGAEANSYSTSPGMDHGRAAARDLYPGEVVEEEDEDRRARAPVRNEENDEERGVLGAGGVARRGRGGGGGGEDEEAEIRGWPRHDAWRSRPAALHPPGSPAQGSQTSRGGASSSAVPSSQSDVADYNAEVTNALSVLEQLRHHLMSQQDGRPGNSQPKSSHSSSSPPPQPTTRSASSRTGEHAHVRLARAYGKDLSKVPPNVPLADLFEVAEDSQSEPTQTFGHNKENARRRVMPSTYSTRSGAMPRKAGPPSSTSSASGGALRHYEVVVDSEDDELFDMRDTADDTTENGRHAGQDASLGMGPPVGIAARRQYERQRSDEPKPRRVARGGSETVERALYTMPSNSQSPSASMERRSRSRRQY